MTPTAQISGAAGFDFLQVPLAGSRESRPADLPPHVPHISPAYDSDYSLPSQSWSSNVVGLASDWIDPDAPDPVLQSESIDALHTGECLIPKAPPPPPTRARVQPRRGAFL